MENKILLIEDDPDIAELVTLHLGDAGFALDHADDGRDGLEMALNQPYQMVILDLMLPGLQGTEVCKKIREVNKTLPILMLTSKSDELDKVLGLELGADDYLTKPFSLRELIARVKAMLRRVEVMKDQAEADLPQVLSYDPLRIDLEKRKVTLKGVAVDLTAKEFDLIALFAAHPGRPYNRQELLDIVWGYQFDGYDHTVNSHINRLRAKIEPNPAEPVFIKTVWGVGYRFCEAEELM
ncbi:MAG TPA: response regulator transcription factor [Calditrichia bacterium]|nr:response regulator transcription factor [Calditrichia bacterium]HQV32732.1 response regulator transcription factor [Calditrichia bacterium]